MASFVSLNVEVVKELRNFLTLLKDVASYVRDEASGDKQDIESIDVTLLIQQLKEAGADKDEAGKAAIEIGERFLARGIGERLAKGTNPEEWAKLRANLVTVLGSIKPAVFRELGENKMFQECWLIASEGSPRVYSVKLVELVDIIFDRVESVEPFATAWNEEKSDREDECIRVGTFAKFAKKGFVAFFMEYLHLINSTVYSLKMREELSALFDRLTAEQAKLENSKMKNCKGMKLLRKCQEELQNKFEEQVLRVAFMGHTHVGKSSLLNALIGSNELKVAKNNKPTTKTPQEIYAVGKGKGKASDDDDQVQKTTTKERTEVQPAEMKKLITHDDKVCLKMEEDVPYLLKIKFKDWGLNGRDMEFPVRFVDSPGLGDKDKNVLSVIKSVLDSCDVIIFLHSNNVIDTVFSADLDFVTHYDCKFMDAFHKRFFLVITKGDLSTGGKPPLLDKGQTKATEQMWSKTVFEEGRSYQHNSLKCLFGWLNKKKISTS